MDSISSVFFQSNHQFLDFSFRNKCFNQGFNNILSLISNRFRIVEDIIS